MCCLFSGNCHWEVCENTPAMLEVMKLKKLRDLEDAPPPAPEAVKLLPPAILSIAPIPPEVAALSAPTSPRSKTAGRLKTRALELSRLDPFLPDPETNRRRTRSAGRRLDLLMI